MIGGMNRQAKRRRTLRITTPFSVATLVALAATGGASAQSEPSESDRGDARDLFTSSPDDVLSYLTDMRFDRSSVTQYDPFTLLRGETRKMNNRLDKAARIRLGFALTSVYQYATWAKGPKNAASSDFDFFGRWRPLQTRETLGFVIFQAEARWSQLTDIAPQDLSVSIGSLWGTSNGFSDNLIRLKQIYWQQFLLDNTLSYRIGKLDQSAVFNTNRMQSDNLYFLNAAFSDNPTMAYPDNGLGGDVLWRPHNLVYFGYGISLTNEQFLESSADPLLADAEWFTALEVGFTPWFDDLGGGKYRLTAWHTSATKSSMAPASTGFALSCDQDFGSKWLGFLRYGYSDGHLTETDMIVSGGLAFKQVLGKMDDIAGVGAAWGRPSDPTARDQFVAEAFYRLQLTPAIQVTPDAQLIVHPSFSPQQSTVWVLGVRVRITF